MLRTILSISVNKEFFKFVNKFHCIANLAFPDEKNFPAFFAELTQIMVDHDLQVAMEEKAYQDAKKSLES